MIEGYIMELKPYQKAVIADLTRYLDLLTQTHSSAKAYNALWNEKGVMVGDNVNGMPFYRTQIPGTPEVCFKVPTGGGKTFLAASCIKPIFDSMLVSRAKAVVWLVPSDAILTQTYGALSNPDHPYRQKLDVDFGGCVEVYSKTQLLNGQNFNPTSVVEQLSVFVLSYDSFRTSKKEGRKAYQENGNLAMFPRQMMDKSVLLPDTDETALIQVIRSLNPVVIVDESHHASSTLSIEMLRNFNPCFVLDLTATPKAKSNIISFVDAAQLKKANMVKLPVIVYNRKSQEDVFGDAIGLRNRLEQEAIRNQSITGRYIRPIVLFQAQPKNNADSTTYQKIKDTLIEAGIHANQIAIKTADKDELKNVDLRSTECLIRYIITVNALKEGWDCPFAYILATIANRNSTVDVEQILGRVLRLPDASKNPGDVLNMSYVLTCSARFFDTLEKIVAGLNNAGFSAKDCRAKDVDIPVPAEEKSDELQTNFELPSSNVLEENSELPAVDVSILKKKVTISSQQSTEAGETAPAVDVLLRDALQQNNIYEEELAAAEDTYGDAPMEVREKMNQFRMREEFAEEASNLCLPQFMLKVAPNFFSGETTVPLSLDHLSEDFTLKDKDTQIDFSTLDVEMARVDVEDKKDATPVAWVLQGADSSLLKEWISSQPSRIRLEQCKGVIRLKISKLNCINEKELVEYISCIVDNMTEDQVSDFEQSPYPYALKVDQKVKSLLAEHRMKTFDRWLKQEKIVCSLYYSFPATISPTDVISSVPKSLYVSEESMNAYERKMVWTLASLDNIKWWHRNISKRGFQINGPIHAYPDIIAMTNSGKVLIIETKGDHLDGDDSKEKAMIGFQWEAANKPKFRYFMVFQSKAPNFPGAYGYDEFMEIVKEL